MEFQTIANFNTNNLTCHPFIYDLGSHSTLVSDNVLSNIIQFYAFKAEADEWLENVNKEQKPVNFVTFFNDYYSYLNRKKLFESAGLFVNSHKTGVIDHAVELGLMLDYDALMDSFKGTINASLKRENEEHLPFFQYMNYLSQICELKVLESKMLYIFKNDIEYESANESISTLSAIENATNVMYVVCQTPYAFTNGRSLSKEIAKFSKLLKNSDNISDADKRKLISRYSNLPLIIYENTIRNMLDSNYESTNEFCDVVNQTICGICENNFNIVEQLKNIDAKVGLSNEESTYEANAEFLDPSIR